MLHDEQTLDVYRSMSVFFFLFTIGFVASEVYLFTLKGSFNRAGKSLINFLLFSKHLATNMALSHNDRLFNDINYSWLFFAKTE